MISHVSIVSVYVSDQDKALEFYIEKLGFEKQADERFGPGFRWLEVAPPGAQTSLVLAAGYGDGAERIGKSTGLVFHAPDIEETYRTLAARGVRFSEPPTPRPWGMKQALFEDQDGNGFVLVGP